MWRIIIMLCIVTMAIATVDKVSYEGYKLFSMVPKTLRQLMILKDLEYMGNAEYSFWQAPSVLNKEVFLMIPPHNLDPFFENMTHYKMPIQIRINNIQKLIDNTSPQNKSQGFDFKHYQPLEKIYDNLEELAKKFPNKVQIIVVGKTYEGREIKGVKISSGVLKPGIFIEGGIHAREWISPATVMYILHQLLTSEDSDAKLVADSYNWFIFPVFNPDGYVFSHVKDRLWRKNRQPSSATCIGSDLNRNWDYHWNTIGISNNPCDDNYPGSEPFSETEMKTISDYIKSNLVHFDSYISFHGFSQQLMFPYDQSDKRIYDYDHGLYRNGLVATEALTQRYNTQYEVGTIDNFHRFSGSSVDYIFHVFRKPVVYLYKLRDKGQYGYLLPPEQIIPTGEETLDSLIVLFKRKLSLMLNEKNFPYYM